MLSRFAFVSVTFIAIFASTARATVTFTGTPVDSWAYFRLPAPQIGEDDQYFATARAEYAGSQLQGYVADAIWGNPIERAEFHIFTTYATSSTTQQLSLLLDGDDGHSLFVNDSFVGGGGFDADVGYMLNMQAGVPVKLEVAGFNGPGDWVFIFGQSNGTLLSQTSAVSLDATNVVPEPSVTVAMMLFTVLVGRTSRRHRWFRSRTRSQQCC